jgi:hypothetical protein
VAARAGRGEHLRERVALAAMVGLPRAGHGADMARSSDGRNLGLKKVAGGTTTVYIFSGTRVIAEYQNGAAPNAPAREYI